MASFVESDVLACPVAGDHRVHRLAGGTEMLGEYKDSAYQEPKYLVQRADGQVMQLPRLLYRVACSLDGRDDGQIAADVNAELGQDLTAEQVSFLVEERLRPVGLIASDDAESGHPDDGASVSPAPVRSDPLLALRYRVGVIPAAVAWRIAGFFRVLFTRPAWVVLLAGFVAVDVWIVAQGDVLGRIVAGVQDVAGHPSLILAILGLGLVSTAFHECGHVSACRYGGARPGDLGVGLYLVWPAFYSTVTDSYRLDRVGRLRTDLGGIYFNALFMLGLGLVYVRTGEPWLLIALIGMHAQTAWQFLPSLRLDGYYILADLVGVPDLFGYVRPVLASLLPWRPTHPLMRQLKPRARRLVLLWVVLVVPTLIFYLVAFLIAVPHVLPAAWRATLQYLQGLNVAARDGDVVATTLGVFQLLVLALPWVGVCLIIWSLAGILRRVLAARWGVGGISDAARTAIRRALAVAALGSLGALLVARVAAVASSHPATAGEARLTDSAVAAVRGVEGGPTVAVGEWLAREQLVRYADLTGAFDRHTTVLTGGRELAVLASAVLVGCLLALVLIRCLPPLAAALPLLAILAMGPAVSVLATAGPLLLGAAWTAVGVLALAHFRRRVAMLLGFLAVAVGVITEPMLAVLLAAGIAAMLAHDQLGAGRPAWWPARLPGDAAQGPVEDRGRTHSGPSTATTGPRHAAVASRPGKADPGLWLAMALLLTFGAFGAALSTGRGDTPLDGPERAVLLLVAGLIVGAGFLVRRLRPPALATAVLVVLAALPWAGSGTALLVALLAVAALAALLTDGLIRGPVQERPHPLLRAAVAVPALVLTVVGALFLPVAAVVPHAELAAWITGPSSAGGTVAVLPGLWGDLIRDGVPPDRLVLVAAPGSTSGAPWTVEVGDATRRAPASATFGTGEAALTVLAVPPEEAQLRQPRRRQPRVARHS
jgi:putative peptide zinc metalloprotease protein